MLCDSRLHEEVAPSFCSSRGWGHGVGVSHRGSRRCGLRGQRSWCSHGPPGRKAQTARSQELRESHVSKGRCCPGLVPLASCLPPTEKVPELAAGPVAASQGLRPMWSLPGLLRRDRCPHLCRSEPPLWFGPTGAAGALPRAPGRGAEDASLLCTAPRCRVRPDGGMWAKPWPLPQPRLLFLQRGPRPLQVTPVPDQPGRPCLRVDTVPIPQPATPRLKMATTGPQIQAGQDQDLSPPPDPEPRAQAPRMGRGGEPLFSLSLHL